MLVVVVMGISSDLLMTQQCMASFLSVLIRGWHTCVITTWEMPFHLLLEMMHFDFVMREN